MKVDNSPGQHAEEVHRYREILDNLNDAAMIKDAEGHYLVINAAGAAMLAMPAHDIIGSTDAELFGAEPAGAMATIERQVRETGEPATVTKTLPMPDGERVFESRISAFKSIQGATLGTISVCRDCSLDRERQKAQEELAKQQKLFETLFHDAPTAIVMVDHRRRIQLVNPAFEKLFGYSAVEVAGQTTTKLYAKPDDYTNQGLQRFNPDTKHRTGSYETEYRRRDGQVFVGDTRASVLRDDNGAVIGYLAHIRDATERRRQDEMKQAFISTVSHELRTPLTSLSGALSLIKGGAAGQIPEKMSSMLNIAISNSARLGGLINDLLDMEKLASGKMTVNLSEVSLVGVIDQVIASLSTYAEPYQVQIRHLRREDIQVCVDVDRLTQILNNLLSNACKHSPPGSTVFIDHYRLDQNRFLLRVTDHGPGIPEHFRPHVFEKFAQADGDNTRKSMGTGLGLALCKELVTLLHGVIGYESEAGKGTRFWLRLPIDGEPDELSPSQNTPPRILHVEDDNDLAAVVRAQLQAFEVAHVTTLAEAKAYVQRHSVDLILLDLFLPDGNGQELWEEVHIAQPKLPIAVLSGFQVPAVMADQVAAIMTKGDIEGGVLQETLSALLRSPA